KINPFKFQKRKSTFSLVKTKGRMPKYRNVALRYFLYSMFKSFYFAAKKRKRFYKKFFKWFLKLKKKRNSTNVKKVKKKKNKVKKNFFNILKILTLQLKKKTRKSSEHMLRANSSMVAGVMWPFEIELEMEDDLKKPVFDFIERRRAFRRFFVRAMFFGKFLRYYDIKYAWNR